MPIFGDRAQRCSVGHLFVSRESLRLFGSVHLGAVRKMRRPVDGKLVTVGNVRAKSLTAGQLVEARRYRA